MCIMHSLYTKAWVQHSTSSLPFHQPSELHYYHHSTDKESEAEKLAPSLVKNLVKDGGRLQNQVLLACTHSNPYLHTSQEPAKGVTVGSRPT